MADHFVLNSSFVSFHSLRRRRINSRPLQRGNMTYIFSPFSTRLRTSFCQERFFSILDYFWRSRQVREWKNDITKMSRFHCECFLAHPAIWIRDTHLSLSELLPFGFSSPFQEISSIFTPISFKMAQARSSESASGLIKTLPLPCPETVNFRSIRRSIKMR